MGKRELPETTVMEDTIIKSQGSATLSFQDADSVDDVVSATVSVDLTDTGSGSEDADVSMKAMIAGALTEYLGFDASASMVTLPLNLTVTGDTTFTGAAGVEDTFTATFDQSVGAKTVVVRKIGKSVTLEIPTGSTADRDWEI